MFGESRGVASILRASKSVVALAALIGTLSVSTGCGNKPSSPASALGPPPAIPKSPAKVVVIRFGNGDDLPEPTVEDVEDGLEIARMVKGSHFQLSSASAEGDRSKIAGLVENAVKDGAAVIVTLHPETTKVAAEKAGAVPVVFGMSADPKGLKLGRTDGEHNPKVTGAYEPFSENFLFIIARSSFADAKLGILSNPSDPLHPWDKDALLKLNGSVNEVVTAEARDASEIAKAVKTLADAKVKGIVVCPGFGNAFKTVVEEADKVKLPVFGYLKRHVELGAVLARVPDTRWPGFEAGRRAARILQGGDPAAIKFTQGGGHQTYFDPKLAKERGVIIPGGVLRDAIDVTKPAS